MMGLKEWWQRRHMYVIADAKDNSVTLSKSLFEAMGGERMECDKVIVSRAGLRYVFTNEHGIEEGKTALMAIQINTKYKCVGFECSVPTLNRIFYDYGLPADVKVKLSVRQKVVDVNGKVMRYYELVPPSRKFIHYIKKHDQRD